LTRWNQLKQLEALQHGLGSMFSRSPVQWPEGQEEQIAVAEWAPLVDISEDDKEYLIKAELPEVKREDVKVTAVEGTLTITGERKFEKEEKGKKYYRVERFYGSFVRNFSLPDDGCHRDTLRQRRGDEAGKIPCGKATPALRPFAFPGFF
jgi:HSP20 family protein